MKETGTFIPLIDTLFFRVIVCGQPKKGDVAMSFFDFGKGRSERARRVIAELNLAPYVAKAVELFGLKSDDIVQAMLEYRHLLYLMYWSKRLEERTVVVPTELADKLWHAHILFTRDYVAMCDKVTGSYLHHQPGLQKGTVEHTVAMKRTRELHHHIRRAGKTPGFEKLLRSPRPQAGTAP